jgi:hypothetical protein
MCLYVYRSSTLAADKNNNNIDVKTTVADNKDSEMADNNDSEMADNNDSEMHGNNNDTHDSSLFGRARSGVSSFCHVCCTQV